MTAIVLPPDPFWLLRVPVPPGGSTPFECWMWWHYQFFTAWGEA